MNFQAVNQVRKGRTTSKEGRIFFDPAHRHPNLRTGGPCQKTISPTHSLIPKGKKKEKETKRERKREREGKRIKEREK